MVKRKRKILVVEDESIVAMDIKNRLLALGYSVPALAHDAVQAVKKAEEIQPDLVLMDIMLKGNMDGIEAANQIQDKFDIPVILLTAYADESTLERAKITEPYGYILKPFEERELYTSIEMALYKHEAERRLKEREQWLSTTLKSIGDGVIATDTKGHITFINNVAEELTGWKQDEVSGIELTKVFNIINERTKKPPENPVEKVLKQGIVLNVANHTILVSRNGREIPIDNSAAPIRDENGVIIGAIIVFRDVSERKRVELALKESEEKFRRITNSAQDAIIMIDDQERIVYWNKAAEKIFGFTKEEIKGERVFKLFITDENFIKRLNSFRQFKSSAKKKSMRNIFELSAIRKDGSEFPAEISFSAFKIKGRLNGVTIIRDITERKQAEEALRQEKERAEQLYKVVPSAIFTVDTDNVITTFNDKASEILGYKPEEVIGKKCTLFSLTPCSEGCRIFGEKPQCPLLNQECTVRRKDGAIRIISKNADVLRDINGNVIGGIESFEDITERKKAEEQLRRAKEEAEAATRAKSEFLANMSHEIRTPMNAVIGMTGLLLGTELDDEQRDFVETIRSSGEALLEIINDILDFSKIESGKMKLENQPFDLIECVEECLDLHANHAAQKGLELGYIMDPSTPKMIKGDVTRIRQILNNLLSNAIKFTHKGEILVIVDAKKTAGKHYKVHFAVKDTGVGIPENKIGQLFQSFSQVDASITRKYGGTGLGLAISKHLVELMGGKIWVESELGKGSTFHFDIKCEAINVTSNMLENLEQYLKGKKILIVDDNETNRRIVSLQVKPWGMEPYEADSGRQALEYFHNGQKFDIAILDMHMPEMDGLTLAREIRKLPNGNKLPMVMLTSLGLREIKEDDVDNLFSAYMSKPVKQSQLLNTVLGILGEKVQIKKAAPKPELDPEMATRMPLRILLAEDNVVNQKLAIHLLQKMGYRADVVGNGLEALEAVQRQSYDVILMDVQMPEMDGLEATRRIRAMFNDPKHPHIIAMTALAMEGDQERCLNAGMNDYVSKPIRIEELTRALENAGVEISLKAGSTTMKEEKVKQEKTIDPEVLNELRETVGAGDEEMFNELLSIYLDDAPNLIAEMEKAFEIKDQEKLTRASHTLKSSSATIGAMALSTLCKEVELASRNGELDALGEKIEHIKQEFEQVKKALKDVTSDVMTT